MLLNICHNYVDCDLLNYIKKCNWRRQKLMHLHKTKIIFQFKQTAISYLLSIVNNRHINNPICSGINIHKLLTMQKLISNLSIINIQQKQNIIAIMKINTIKESIINLQNCELISLSHQISIAGNLYYLVELKDCINKKTVFTWQQISVIQWRFSKNSLQKQMDKLKSKGKEIERITNWPENKNQALLEIKAKFWDSEYQRIQNEEQCQKQPNKQKQIKGSKKLNKFQQAQNIKQYEFEDELNRMVQNTTNKLRYMQQPSQGQCEPQPNKIKPSSISTSHSIQRRNPHRSAKKQTSLAESNSGIKQRKQLKRHSFQYHGSYLKIVQLKRNYKRKQINYTIQNILGDKSFATGKKLKETHLYEVIVFLEKYLGIEQ